MRITRVMAFIGRDGIYCISEWLALAKSRDSTNSFLVTGKKVERTDTDARGK